METREKARMDDPLIRSHMAKMIVNYAIHELKKIPDTSRTCTFTDIESESEELQ